MSGTTSNETPLDQRPAASWGWRILALVIDWIGSYLVCVALYGGPTSFSNSQSSSWAVLALFWAETMFGIALAGGSFGQLATRIRVVRMDGRPLGLLQSALRQALVCLVIPPLVFRPDGRGLHDLAAGSRTYRL